MTRQQFAEKWGYQSGVGYGSAQFDCTKQLLEDLNNLVEKENAIAVSALKDIADWTDDLEDEHESTGAYAKMVLDKIRFTRISNKLDVRYGWSVGTGGNWLKNYPEINEDENTFDSRENAIHWLNVQKLKNKDFGASECFILKEMFFV